MLKRMLKRKGMNMGGCIVSRNILENKGRLKWCFREESVNRLDNGWCFLSEVDTDEFLANPKNMVVCDWGTMFEIEPAIMPIFDMPVGTELTLEYESGRMYFVNSETGEAIKF